MLMMSIDVTTFIIPRNHVYSLIIISITAITISTS
jgi:hypothetical protein